MTGFYRIGARIETPAQPQPDWDAVRGLKNTGSDTGKTS